MTINCETCRQAIPDMIKAVRENKGPEDIVWPDDFKFLCTGRGCHHIESTIKPWRPWTIKPETKPSVSVKWKPLRDGLTPTFFGG